MTKKDFKRYMCQGLGRCYIHLRDSKNIDKYKDIVLWGCLHNLSYDIQCEGTRAEYVYELTKFFSDNGYFVLPTVKKLEKLPNNRYVYDDISHFSQLLRRFAEAGSEEALSALRKKRREYLEILINKRSHRSYDFLRDYFERISIAMIPLIDLLELVADFGRLFISNKHYNMDEFEWFSICLENYYGAKRLLSFLKKETKHNSEVSVFYDGYLALKSHNAEGRPHRERRKESIDELAERLFLEEDPDKKADILFKVSFKENIPKSIHERIIEYARSDNDKLSENALYALTYCKSDAVYSFAKSILDSDRKTAAIEMLLMNYRPEDKDSLFAEIKNYTIGYNSKYDWHSITSKIISASDAGIHIPKEYLMYVYENTLCSYCRQNAVEALSKRRMLDKNIMKECGFDSNYDIVKYINRYYKKHL